MDLARILVVNAGSSTVKLSVIGARGETLETRELEAPRPEGDPEALRDALDDRFRAADAVGHRIVHGGDRFRGPVLILDEVESALRELSELAPLHQAKSLAALDVVSAALPGVPAVACFDTAFHADMPLAARTYALPASWRKRWPIRRYGFHGLSHGWVARRVPELLGVDAARLRIVSCHLGAGASLCAVADGKSVATTMGFTPLEGLVMATRSGSVDPGLLLWLLEHEGISTADMNRALEHESGLQGLAGTPDMREVLARREAADADASLAVAMYLERLCMAIAAMAAAMGGLDVLVFTGGVGERSSVIRSESTAMIRFLGVSISDRVNDTVVGDGEISSNGAPVRTLVIQAREDLEIARQVRETLGSPL